MVVAGAILGLQIHFINDISRLIAEANLDLVPVTSTFCRNLSVVGFIFLVQCGDVGIHLISYLYNGKTKEEQNESNSTYFLVLGISVQVLTLLAYLGFCRLIWRSTKLGRTFDDLILHHEVPELVYL